MDLAARYPTAREKRYPGSRRGARHRAFSTWVHKSSRTSKCAATRFPTSGARRPAKALLNVGFYGGNKTWLNGTLVVFNYRKGIAKPVREQVEVELREG